MISKSVVMVTGAGGGIGRAICKQFHTRGYHVVATDYDPSVLSDLVGKDGYTIAKLDVSKAEDAQQIAGEITEELGRLDVIVNNAGIDVFSPVTETPPEKTVQGFMINTFAALFTTQACLDLLIASKGTVVNISSESAARMTPFQFYQPSKRALEALSETMRRELIVHDVHVAIIRPGPVETPFISGHGNITNPIENSRYKESFERFSARVAIDTPKKKCKPEEVAALVYHAATDPKRKVMYTINLILKLEIMSRLPAKLLDKLILKILRG